MINDSASLNYKTEDNYQTNKEKCTIMQENAYYKIHSYQNL